MIRVMKFLCKDRRQNPRSGSIVPLSFFCVPPQRLFCFGAAFYGKVCIDWVGTWINNVKRVTYPHDLNYPNQRRFAPPNLKYLTWDSMGLLRWTYHPILRIQLARGLEADHPLLFHQ